MDILFDDTVIIQLFEIKSICSGILYDENMSENMVEKVEHVFQEQRYKIKKKKNLCRMWKGIIVLFFLNAGVYLGKFWILKLVHIII